MPRIATNDWDDEDWHDDGEPDDGDPIPCPECGKPVYDFVDRCPSCGYWVTDADLRQSRASHTKPTWVLITATIMLIVLVLTLPGIWHLLFG